MFRNYLITAGFICGASSAIAANNFEGWRTSLTLAYSHTQGTLKAQDYGFANKNYAILPLSTKPSKASQNGLNLGLLVGYGTFFQKVSFGGDIHFSYDTTNTKIANLVWTDNQTGNIGSVKFKPGFGVGAGIRLGMLLTEQILGFIGCGLDYNLSKVRIAAADGPDIQTSGIKNAGAWSVIPGLGVEGYINEKLNWVCQIDYKMTFNTKDMYDYNDPDKMKKITFSQKPEAFIVKAGISYKF
jgi:hypothetical protein